MCDAEKRVTDPKDIKKHLQMCSPSRTQVNISGPRGIIDESWCEWSSENAT